MALVQYLLDTNIVIYYFNGIADDEKTEGLLSNSFNLSVISQIEFLGWGGFAADEQLYQKALEFIGNANLFILDERIVQKTIELRQQHIMKTPDAIIASTALIHGFGIATNNNDDFKHLNLEILNIRLV